MNSELRPGWQFDGLDYYFALQHHRAGVVQCEHTKNWTCIVVESGRGKFIIHYGVYPARDAAMIAAEQALERIAACPT